MDPETIRMINLLECLSEDHPDTEPPPDDEAATWTEPQLRAFFASSGTIRPEARDLSVPGGSRALSPSPRADPRNAPPLDDTARARLITAESYRDAAFKHGIPFRPNGLFPIGDSLLTELAADSTLVPFQKNVVDVDDAGGARFALAGSWANGDLAAANGLDLRCFYRSESDARVKHGQLVAAFRLGDRAGIGHRMWTTAHGGSIETVLDETTAELVKCAVTPDVATVEFTAKLKRAVRLHETYRVDCEVTRATSVRVWTRAEISDPKDVNVYATCEACLADLGAVARLGK